MRPCGTTGIRGKLDTLMRRTPSLLRVHGTACLLAAVLAAGFAHEAAGHAPPEELEQEARAMMARQPPDPGAHLEAGRIFQSTGAWDAAIVAFERAGELGADGAVVMIAKGQVYLDAGWPRMAERELTRALAARPEAYGALYDRGRARMALGNAEGAAADFERAVAGIKEPRPEQIYAWRDALLTLGKRDEALRALDDGMVRLGPIPSLQLAALDLELERGAYPAALARLDALLATSPRNPVWIARRADVLDRLDRTEEACAERSRALAAIESRPAARRGKELNSLAETLRQRLATARPQEDRQ